MIRLAFVGTSGHYGYVLSDLQRYPQVRVVACAASYEGEDTTAFASLPECTTYPDWGVLLDVARPDIVVACGRHDLNATIAVEAARHGCHVISEKPAAVSESALNEVERAVRASGVQYTMLLGMRYEPAWFTAHSLVQQGVIGAPFLISGQKSYRWGRRPFWYADREAYGSTMAWVGIHLFDLARWIGGAPYTRVAAHHANLAHPDRPAVQDVCAIIAALANGGSAAFTLDYMRPDAAGTHGDDRLRIVGEHGILEVCDGGQRVSVINRDGAKPAWPLVTPQRDVLGDMLAALAGTGDLLISAAQAWEMTRFSLLAAAAADEGDWRHVVESGEW